MEICDERIHAAKFTRRMDEYRRFSHVRARSLQWLLMRREEIFDRADGCSSHSNTAPGAGRKKRTLGVARYLIELTVNGVINDSIGRNGLEGPQADMQRHVGCPDSVRLQ